MACADIQLAVLAADPLRIFQQHYPYRSQAALHRLHGDHLGDHLVHGG